MTQINFDYMPDNPEDHYRHGKGWQGWRNFYGNDFLSFKKARDFVRKLNLKGWKKYCKSGNKPNNIPSNPNITYKNKWKGMEDFLGTKNFLPFEKARDFVRKLNLKNQKEWFKYCKSGNKPNNIPYNPHQTYKDKWKGYGNFLGNDFLPFKEARKFVIKLKLKSGKEWKEYCKSGDKPNNIPYSPYKVYKDKWISWGDFLGTGNVYKKDFLSFEESRKFVRKLKLKSTDEWKAYCKLNRSCNIPFAPYQVYKDEWISWGNFLGTEAISPKNRVFLPFEEARKFAIKLKLKSGKEWFKYCKSGKKPNNIPTCPNIIYKNKWKGMGDFLGTGNIYKKDFLSFKEAREFIRKLKLKNGKEWKEYCKSGKKPDNIPSCPHRNYKDKWISWYDFLGTGNVHKKDFLSFKEAREFARKLKLKNWKEWKEYCKSGNKPNNIPSAPYRTYKDEWKGMTNWLGKKKKNDTN